MSRNYKFSDQESLYFVTFTVIDWIDTLTRAEYKDIIVDSIRYCMKHKGLEVFAWCIMTNHVHMIIGTNGQKLEDIVRDLKRHTSKSILKEIELNTSESRSQWMLWMFERAGRRNPNNRKYQFWQQHNHPIELNTNYLLEEKLQYIHENPVKAGMVWDAEHYPYSSAVDYSGGKGIIPIGFID